MADFKGKICLITGASSGIGKALAQTLALQGAHVALVCRNRETGNIALQEMSGSAELFLADLSSQRQILHLRDSFFQKHSHLDLLIHSAGVLLPRRTATEDGLEMTFAVNHLAPFMLTRELMPALQAAPESRIIILTSRAEELGRIDLTDLQKENHYSAFASYNQSKLANLLFCYALAKRLDRQLIFVNAVHPGLIASQLGRNLPAWLRALLTFFRPLMKSPERAAEEILHLATTQAQGQYFRGKKEAKSSPTSYDAKLAEQLWTASERLTRGECIK